MSETGNKAHSNGVVRIGRKGLKKFAFGDDGAPFEVDVVVAFQAWSAVDRQFREQFGDEYSDIPSAVIPDYYAQALGFVGKLAGEAMLGQSGVPVQITTAEALDFLARLREQYDECAAFFRPKSREERDSPDTSAAELRFSEEPAT